MARRSPKRREKLKAPGSDYTDGDGNVLTLRGSLTPGARREYAEILAGNTLSQEDAWQRAVELLFERLEFILNPATARFLAAGTGHGPRLELLGDSG